MMPKGKLLLIGGHEDKGNEIAGENLKIQSKKEKQSHFEILGSLISKIPRANHSIEVIAAASSISKEMEELYVASYKQEGFTKVGIIHLNEVEDASNQGLIKRIEGAHAVFFTGGDQSKLVSLLANTKLIHAIRNKYHSDKNFIVGGTSAGAMAMPEIIIAGGILREALYHDDIKIATGLNLITEIIVDTHFIKRGRFARLAHAVALNSTCLGIGLEENTALLISEGNIAECLGTGMVIIMDGSELGLTNIESAVDTIPIIMENMKFSILAEGTRYSICERKIQV
ncbi:MAG: cyanophycinase [Bacteroidetes bacterium B1(2017)]|nr:MAG: cyanophycinase [Bacteroidetes bacterium B1(2017)]